MKLYYLPGACSQASNIALREAGLKFELVKVDRLSKKAADGLDFNEVNPKGYVPALTLDSGETLTENICVLSYIGDRNPAAGLAPAQGTMARYRLLEWLAFVSAEIHKNFSPLFRQDLPEQTRSFVLGNLTKRLDYLQGALGSKSYLTGEQLTIADCYLGVVLGWAGHVKLDLGPWPELKRYVERFRARPHVVEAMQAEGLIK
ncbi:MAG TPA: glutathione transferase GstA [Steroidobacteraceae bacterium]|nr:glutathione transferase GstA [Steroidobacteraceae bacterium]